MKLTTAAIENAEEIFRLVQDTITAIYPRYYPKEVVDFFCCLHSLENIEEDIANGYVRTLYKDNRLVGTGSCKENHITRVFVTPARQGQGYGSYIMQSLEDELALQYDSVYLDSSLLASRLYEHRGYKTARHETWEVENNAVLVYEVMEKQVKK